MLTKVASRSEKESVSRRACLVAPRGLLRERGQHRGRDGDAEHAERELDQPVRVVEVGDAALRQERRDDRVDDGADVGRRLAHHHRRHQPEDPPDRRVAGSRSAASRAGGGSPSHGTCRRSWPSAAEEHAQREPGHRLRQPRREHERADDDPDVQRDRRQGRQEEVAVGVQDAHRQRRQSHEEQVREHQARHAHGQLRPPRDRRRSRAP